MDTEIEKLSDLQQELYAMELLTADEDIIKKQKAKIKRQEVKIIKLQKANLEA